MMIAPMRCTPLAVLATTVLLLTHSAHAAFKPGEFITDPGLPGHAEFDGWLAIWNADESQWDSSLSRSYNPGFPGHPGNGDWPGPMTSKTGSEGHDAGLVKLTNGSGGGAFPSSSSLYFGGMSDARNNYNGTLAVIDTTPVSGLANVVFQIQIGEIWGYDFWDGDGDGASDLPLLSYNGGAQNLPATYAAITHQIQNDTYDTPTGEEPVYINTHLLQWDLSSVAEPITEFSISFSGVQHAQVYAMRLDQSDTFSVVPEPAALGLCGIGMLLLRRRR